ncbi:S41 family peptidase [Flavobacterium sp. ov086]|uniref:S41 family peptidase n=1 Tax=Flavobacterium sp. ov086 TaxID=1761785 RepID=UPI000B71BEED|nr:S41 family peptidase [Flavobacterium sp. ov086]SNR48562.1 C-terminal processing protease CtpA/Prc, contains a PDZ domain [Flavobacterium sp. ov086]
MKYSSLIRILFFLFFGIFLISCEVDDKPEVYEEGSNKYTNDWIYNQMKKYYKWNETMPDKGDLAINPKEYFNRLLNKSDLYSYAVNPNLPETVPQSLRRNFGFDISFTEHQNKIYGVILYALYDSPAKNNGLLRGQLITKINDEELNLNNYDKIYKSIATATHLDLEIVAYSKETGFSNPEKVSLLQGFSFSQPISSQVISNNNTKTGYVEIPHFDVGQAQLFLQTFQELKNQNVTELVLDLRYNGGGDVSSATALSIILAPNIKSSDLFIQFEGNKNGGIVKQSFQQALESNERNVSFEVLKNTHPDIKRVYILCGKRTASASEIIINNLRPFMDVITIGEKTVGKDVAGFPIEDDRIPNTKGWILYPSIYKLFNAKHEGNYSGGINPSLNVDELQDLEIFALGNRSEILLSTAINMQSGNTGKMKTETLRSLPLSKIYIDADPLLVMH